MKVTFLQTKQGTNVPNHYIITHEGQEYLQSYNTVVCRRVNGMVYLDEEKWNYSSTTVRRLGMFLRKSKSEILELIRDGKYVLTDLN